MWCCWFHSAIAPSALVEEYYYCCCLVWVLAGAGVVEGARELVELLLLAIGICFSSCRRLAPPSSFIFQSHSCIPSTRSPEHCMGKAQYKRFNPLFCMFAAVPTMTVTSLGKVPALATPLWNVVRLMLSGYSSRL